MTSSQKHCGKILVPWFNTNEWKHVYNSIFNESSTHISKLRALQLLHMWKTRTPRLPSGVEGTLIILDAILQDKRYISEEKLRSLYGTAIMRFLNLCGASGDKQGTFYRTARQNNLPDWLIDLRHDIAHDQIIPSRCMLEMGLEVCLDWLKREYWGKQDATITDYVISLNPDRRIETVVKLYCQINLIQYLNKSKSLIELDDPTLMEKFEIIEDIALIDLNMPIKDVLAVLLEALNSNITNMNTNEELISEAVIENGSMFSIEIFKDFNVTTIPSDFVLTWEPLLNLLHENNMLIVFIKKLIDIISSNTLEKTKKRIANLWLSEILKGLMLTKDIYDRYHKLPNHHKLNKETASVILKNTIQNENPDLRQALDFDIDYYEGIRDDLVKATLNIIENANSFTLELMPQILKFCGLSDCSASRVKEIVEKYVLPVNANETRIEDHTYALGSSMQTIPNNEEILNIMFSGDTQFSTNMDECSDIDNSEEIYKRVEDTSIFEGCSLGVCKGQDRDTNPLLLF